MIFQEPQVEFVPVTMNSIMTSSPQVANYETCNGSNAYSNACNANSIKWADNADYTTCLYITYDDDSTCVN